MYKRKLVLLVLIAMVLSSCASMANLQEAWNKLTPDGKARIIASGFQTQLDTLFDTGKAYVVANPDKQTVWKTQAVPAFDTCNKALRVYMIGNTTPEEVYNAIPPLLESVVKSLKAMGVSL